MLLLSDRVDEWVVSHLDRVRGQAARLGGQGRPRPRQAGGRGREEGTGSAGRRVQGTHGQDASSLGEQVKEVRVTHRLTDSPACLVADEHDMSGNLARMLKAAGQKVPDSKPILEINPEHPVVQRLKYEEKTLRRLGRGAVRPGPAGRGRPARGSGELRQAGERPDAGDGGSNPSDAAGSAAHHRRTSPGADPGLVSVYGLAGGGAVLRPQAEPVLAHPRRDDRPAAARRWTTRRGRRR